MNERFRRMATNDVKSIVLDLDRWADGQLGSKLTWATLEERFGFSRQSLQAKPEIKAAYDLAKKALSGGLIKSREQASKDNDELQRDIARLKLEIIEYHKREDLWKLRWQRIAYHIRANGVQMSEIDKPIQNASSPLSESDVINIIKPFDQKIPHSGRI